MEMIYQKLIHLKLNLETPDATGGFKLALVEDTDTLLNEFNIKDPRYKTKMMSGRICYAPRTSSKFDVNYYNISSSFPKQTTTKNIMIILIVLKDHHKVFEWENHMIH